MQHLDRAAGVAAALFCAATLSACQAPAPQSTVIAPAAAGQYAALVAPYAPPPKRAEIPPPAASPQALWRFGHWQWSGERFVWEPGRYILRPSPTVNWIPGYWHQAEDGWVWTDGRWAS